MTPTRRPPPPSGAQIHLRHGDQSATIVEVGGGVREYSVGGREVLQPYDLDAICDGAHGAPLVPWPNRLADGRYVFDGTHQQVPLTEPEKSNAIHGVMRWRSWQPSEQAAGRVTMVALLHPMPGYPYALDLRVTYELDDAGLRVTTTATNIGATTCPYGHGQHPYLSPGSNAVLDDCRLELAARTRIETDPQRQLPIGLAPVSGTVYDFRTPHVLGDLAIDHAFTDLDRDADGRAWVRLTGPDGATVSLWADQTYPYLEVYTGETLAPERQRRGLAAEPMTCPPNAFATGQGVLRLEPGDRATTTWGVTLD